jgi:hypothetical protein
MRLRFLNGGEELAIVNRAFAESVSVLSGYRVREFGSEAEVLPVVRQLLAGGHAAGPLRDAAGTQPGASSSDDEILRKTARRILAGDLKIISRSRAAADTFVHPRPIPTSPRQMEAAQRQRDPEPAPPPPPMTPAEPLIIIPEEQAAALVTDAPVCET